MSKVTTGEVRFSYANVFEPKAINNSDPKFSISILIPKNDTLTLSAINRGIQEAYEEGKSSKLGNKLLAACKTPLRDGDAERPDDEAYRGHFFINANSNASHRPQIVDESLQPIIDPEVFYSGCYGRASIGFYAFDRKGNKGIACGLNNLQKLRDGVKLSGGSSAAEDFGTPGGADSLM